MNHLHIQAILLGCKNIISNNKTTIFLLIDVLDPTGFWLLQSTLQLSLGLLGRPAAAGRFGRPGKSAAATVNEQQIELLE